MDFVSINEKLEKDGTTIYPSYNVEKSKDLMVRGGKFYAVWDAEKKLWSTNEFQLQRMIDDKIHAYRKELESKGIRCKALYIKAFETGRWTQLQNYIKSLPDNYHSLDTGIVFSDTKTIKEDYVSRRLDYSLDEGEPVSYNKLLDILYKPEEKEKIEWLIGSIISGESKTIQKFFVFYGAAGTGKSTVLNIVQTLFHGYYTMFDAKALVGSNQFSSEAFKNDPLIAIQHDGDLSKIEDNSKLNSIVSHEEIVINEKFKSSYTAKTNCLLLMGTNKPVHITDAKSGLIRRMVAIMPTGNKLPVTEYEECMRGIKFERGMIANQCLNVFRKLGPDYYNHYQPIEMLMYTNIVYNFVESHYDDFIDSEGITLANAYQLYKDFCIDSECKNILPRYKFRGELQNYFGAFADREIINGVRVRSWFSDFLTEKFVQKVEDLQEVSDTINIKLGDFPSIFDLTYSEAPAQYGIETENGFIPSKKWNEVTNVLKDLDTTKVHYVRIPENHIVIDFDIRLPGTTRKDLNENLRAASKWPKTYTEVSQSGGGVHLHYFWKGDRPASELSRTIAEGIECKVFSGNSALRRRKSLCNEESIRSLSCGLTFKEPKMIDFEGLANEKALRTMISRNLNKEIHPGTKPSVDFIYKILDDAYRDSGLVYDVSDLANSIASFAASSTNHSEYCLAKVSKMHFKSEESEGNAVEAEGKIVFYDVEVFPNLFVVCWKVDGSDKCVRMINPSPEDIEELCRMKLVGFYNRKYDNHILYARMLGYDNKALYELSDKLINSDSRVEFLEAYNISYTDVYDFSSKKQSLKKWEIELGINHLELGLEWFNEVPEDRFLEVAEYCENDVRATEAVFHAREADFLARKILADLSGLTVNDTTQKHTGKIIFGNDKYPQSKFVYTDLSKEFPGYKYEYGTSEYKGLNPSEGGFVYAEPGIYKNVALLDVASLHPTSLIKMNCFGPYTKNFSDLKEARIAIKHGELDRAKEMLDGKLAPYLDDSSKIDGLSYALKIAINIVYGLTSASFPNIFRDKRNVDNIVAKRGALFMIDLKEAVEKKGYTVAHIKTDSIKIPEATPEIIKFVKDFGKSYGYDFEHEDTYSKFCLINDAVYIAKSDDKWHATGAQFAHPYVYKTLFTKEPILFEDLCETKSVTSAMYLLNDDDKYHFIGRVGSFVPVLNGGGNLFREKEGKYYAVNGTKGYKWMESTTAKLVSATIDYSYYDALIESAIGNISKFGEPRGILDDVD